MAQKSIIFLHGWGGSKRSLEELSNEVNMQGYANILLEMPGHGITAEMGSPWKMLDFVNWLKSSLNKREISEYILVGHSFGGKIILAGLEYDLLAPEKIVLIDANGLKHKNSLKKIFWKNISRFGGLFKKVPGFNSLRYLFYKVVIGETDYAKTSNNLRESFKLFNEEFFDNTLNKVSCPTLILWGRKDSQTPIWMAREMKSRIPNSKLVEFDETHGLPLKRPAEVSKEIIKFISND